jgi:hypothetical protein
MAIKPLDQLRAEADCDDPDGTPAGAGRDVMSEFMDEQEQSGHSKDDGQGNGGAGKFGHRNLCRRPN